MDPHKEIKGRIQSNWAFITEHIRVEPVVQQLFKDKHISYKEKNSVEHETGLDAPGKLLNIVYRKPHIYEGFLDALKASKQEAIVARLDTEGDSAITGIKLCHTSHLLTRHNTSCILLTYFLLFIF